MVSLDLALPSSSELLSELIALDDGSAVSEIRLAVARSMVAVRSTSLVSLEDVFSAGEHVLPRVTEPHMVSAFMSSRAYLMAAAGRYTEALAAAKRCEKYAVDVRLPFVVPHARRARAMAELGLRQFPKCKQTVDWLARTAANGDDVFLQVEARLLRARLLYRGAFHPGRRDSSRSARTFPLRRRTGRILGDSRPSLGVRWES